jgi:hypothetical protein
LLAKNWDLPFTGAAQNPVVNARENTAVLTVLSYERIEPKQPILKGALIRPLLIWLNS